MKRRLTELSVLIVIALSVVSTPRAAAAATSLKQLVLSPRDIPSSLGSFRSASPSSLGLPSGGLPGIHVPSSLRHSHGFQESWGSFLVSNGAASGILLIDDGVYRFSSSAGSHWYLGATRHGALLSGDKVTPVRLGSEGVVWSEAGNPGGTAIYLFWRHGRYVGEVTVMFRAHARTSTVLALAGIMDRKFAGAH